MQAFLDYAMSRWSERRVEAQGNPGCLSGRHHLQGHLRLGAPADRDLEARLADWGRNPSVPAFGNYGTLAVR